jgi:hypothetical protein
MAAKMSFSCQAKLWVVMAAGPIPESHMEEYYAEVDGKSVNLQVHCPVVALPPPRARRAQKWHQVHFTPLCNRAMDLGFAVLQVAMMYGVVDAKDRLHHKRVTIFYPMRLLKKISVHGKERQVASRQAPMSLASFTKSQVMEE